MENENAYIYDPQVTAFLQAYAAMLADVTKHGAQAKAEGKTLPKDSKFYELAEYTIPDYSEGAKKGMAEELRKAYYKGYNETAKPDRKDDNQQTMNITGKQFDQIRESTYKACAILEAVAKFQVMEEEGIDYISLIDAALGFCKEVDETLEKVQISQ